MGHSPLIIYYENFQPIYARSFPTKWARSVPNCMKVQVSSHAKLSLPLVDVPVNYNSRSRKFYLFDSSDSTCERGSWGKSAGWFCLFALTAITSGKPSVPADPFGRRPCEQQDGCPQCR